MSELLEIREMLQETHATLAQLERSIAKHPDDWTLAVTAESLKQRQTTLEKAFAEAANADLLDVCKYRLIPDGKENFSIASLTSTLGAFQDLLTVVFDALKNGPKVRPKLSAEIVSSTTLDFGYAYAGSLGFVMTMPNDRMLVGESELDRAIKIIFVMAKAHNPDELSKHIGEVGVAGIRRLYHWCSAHSDYGLSADIKWQRDETERGSVIVQKEEMRRLKEIIDKTSDEKIERFTFVGELRGLDVGHSSTFRFTVPGAEEITGRIAGSFDRTQVYEIHGTYEAQLIKRIKVHYSMEREEEAWELLALGRD
jgi:hypothetical protein